MEEGRAEVSVSLPGTLQNDGAVSGDAWQGLTDNIVHHEEVVVETIQGNFNNLKAVSGTQWSEQNFQASAPAVQQGSSSQFPLASAPAVSSSEAKAERSKAVRSEKSDFSELDPISFVERQPRPKRTRQTSVNKNNQSVAPLPDNPNRHLVPEDLQSLIISTNPNRSIKFTYSQRMNTQMVMDDYMLKKKKGPYVSRGGRIINWKCVNDSCQFTAVTWEVSKVLSGRFKFTEQLQGEIQDTARRHNHRPQPELYIKKQARLKIRENILSESLGCEDRPMSNLVNEVVNETNGEVREMIGSIDALKQAARRFNRKLHKDVKPQESPSSGYENVQQFIPVTNLEDYQVVEEFPVDLQFVEVGDFQSGDTEDKVQVEYFKEEQVTLLDDKIIYSYQQEESGQPGDDLEELLQDSPCKESQVKDELTAH